MGAGLTKILCIMVAAAAGLGVPFEAAVAQSPVDRSDAANAAELLPENAPEAPEGLSRVPILPTYQDIEVDPFVVGAIRLEGAEALSGSAFAGAIEAWVGRRVGGQELSLVARDMAGVARAAGYALATAWIPSQEVENGILVVRIDEGAIDAIDVKGSGAEAVKARLAPLADGAPVTMRRLERLLLEAEDIAGVTLGRPLLDRSGGRNTLRLVAERNRLSARAGSDNWGSSAVGPVRTRLQVEVNGLARIDDRLTVGGVTTPLQPSELQLGYARYAVPLTATGTELAVASYVARTGSDALDGAALAGRSWEVQAALTQPLLRSRATSLWASLSLGVRDTRLERADEPFRADRIVAATASLAGTAQWNSTRLRGRASLTQGLDMLGATAEGDTLSSRIDADGAFTRGNIWLQGEHPLTGPLSLAATGEAQLSLGGLLASEEMGLGGRDMLRAFDHREVAGDSGLAGSLELRYDLSKPFGLVSRAQLYSYVDGGQVWNRGSQGWDAGLASAGSGVRLWITDSMFAGVEVGVPLTRSPLDDAPKPRISIAVSRSID